MRSRYNKRNYVILGLCLVLVLMAVGYAAFSQLLTINGTGQITSNWCVGFDSTRTSDYVPTAGISGGTLPTGSIGFSGNVCETNYQTTASLSASFNQPGDQIVYTLTIYNKSSLNAAIKSILVEGNSVTEKTTITKGNMTFIVDMPEKTSLSANDYTTMKVTAEFQDDTPIAGTYTGENQTITIGINVNQDDGSGGIPVAYTIYAYNTNYITIGTSTINDLDSTKTTQKYYTSAADVMSASGNTFFNKYTVENDIITKGYACQKFSFINEPVCLQGVGTSYYTANRGIIEGLTTTFISNGGTCLASDDNGFCSADNMYVSANTYGSVGAYGGQAGENCYVYDYGSAYCR